MSNPESPANMHYIEPFFRWRDFYIASEDRDSPFFGREYSEFEFSNRLYNFYLHPQWDEIGSSTLYCKILFADYEEGYAIIELIGEWNDTLHNDVMFLQSNLTTPLERKGIHKFIFCCDNLLNYHAPNEDDYYAEWAEALREEGGWAVLLNTRPHVVEELESGRIDNYLLFGEDYNEVIWQPHKPQVVYALIAALVNGQIQRVGE